MKQIIALFFGMALITAIVAGIDDDQDIFGPQGSELLKELKESGVIDQFEDELKQMLKQEGAKHKKEEANEDIKEFIKSYVEENSLEITEKILDHLSTLPIGDAGLAKHFVHLSKVLDKIHDLSKHRELDAKVLDVIKRVKSLPVMKTSLNKIKDGPQAKVEKDPPAKKVEAKNELDLGLSSMVKDMITKLKKKPEFFLDLVLPTLSEYGLLSDSTVQMAKIYGQGFVKSDSFLEFLDTLESGLDALATSEGGKRFIEILPQILAADNADAVMDIFRKEAERQWSDFFASMDNSDMLDQLVKSLAEAILAIKSPIQELLQDDMKMALANTFLITQGLPAIKPKRLTESLLKLGDHSIKTFTTWKFELSQYDKDIAKTFEALEKEYVSAKDFNKLNDDEQTTLVARFLRENLIEPITHLWTTYRQVQDHPGCAEPMLCHLNAKMAKEGSVIKSMVTKSVSLMAAFAWTVNDQSKLDRSKLYASIWSGADPQVDCTSLLPTKDNCQAFPWQAKPTMSLNFEHTEL